MTVRDYVCNGNGANGRHCCNQGGVQCEFLVENVEGRRYACGLIIKYENWEAMNASFEYKSVGDFWVSKGLPFNYCEAFDPAFCCRPEYRKDRRNEIAYGATGPDGTL